ncbi:MAG: acyl-CoA/acyl-ACP dehydrogenase [Deltaproteobacteria bacterium]|jgi:butyryl-CoA dehydrogenase|nr:acyl-CoA/acyl-ACP dehydrogenase [Deltaproteobacteria bacterium]MBT4267447.1 acyl-CoA/acyl-ACP dehydrogenase [Deltaproteobacteria bacterium]MBT4637494.1 acyl-CoA/acyl-ACP dehydrogenase [Deltaproteobacteria bacterium]MBT6500836.1 acyl-CoA/acyl-ACP dehydrogenase [Deltaproteobacteria bacterium]MBT7153757.1 acyl-CoA/acyl-ACP dehydrogenase [Deltaproteobacteria bacterium]
MFDYLLTEEQKGIQKEARAFAKWIPKEMILDMDAEKIQFPHEYLREAGKRGLLGVRFPKEYGGRELSWIDEGLINQEISGVSHSLACLWGVGAGLVADAVVNFGSEEMKQEIVVPVAKGEQYAAECLTEPRGGSDFFGATTRARKDGDDWILNGQKRFIVGAEGADWFMVYAVTDPDAPPHSRLSAFMVPRTAGVETKYIYGLMGTRGGGAGRVFFNDVRVPERYVLNGINRGFEVFIHMMVPERLGTANTAIGAVRPAIEIATKYTSKRKAFGTPIKDFQAVGFKVADCVALHDAANSLVYTTTRAIESKTVHPNRVRRMVSEAKKFATDSSWEIINHCMQVLGGIGYTNVYPIERIMRDIRLAMIWTGTNEIMQLVIQNEWYKEYEKVISKSDRRDFEMDAENADQDDEKVYE